MPHSRCRWSEHGCDCRKMCGGSDPRAPAHASNRNERARSVQRTLLIGPAQKIDGANPVFRAVYPLPRPRALDQFPLADQR